MKKRYVWLLAPASTLMLVACGGEQTTGEEEMANGEDTSSNEGTTESLTMEQVLANTTEAMDGINSFRTEMAMNYNIAMDGESMENEPIEMDMVIDAIIDPMEFESSTTVSAPEMGMDIVMDQYMLDGILYMQNPMGGEWMKLDMSNEMQMAQEQQMDAQEQLEMLQQINEHIIMTEEEDAYVLTVEGSDNEFNEFIQSFMAMGQDDMVMPEEEMQALMESSEVENMAYSLRVNKETFYQEAVTMSVDMMIEEEGETVTMHMDVDGTYSMYDEIETIDVPQEAIDEAIDMEDAMGGGAGSVEEDGESEV